MPSIPPPQIVSEPPPERPLPDRQPGPRLWVVPGAVLLALALAICGAVIVEVIAAAAGAGTSHATPAVELFENVALELSFVGAAVYFARTAGVLRPEFFGYRRISVKLGVGAVIVLGAAYYLLTLLYQSVLDLHGHDKLPKSLGVTQHTAALVGAAIYVCVIAPICEELFFRGFVLGVLRRMRVAIGGRELGTLFAVLITGTLFGIAHVGSAPAEFLVPLGFLGCLLCLIRIRTGSLYPCMALHSINNSVALGVAQLSWSAPAIVGLAAGSLVSIAVITGPLAPRD